MGRKKKCWTFVINTISANIFPTTNLQEDQEIRAVDLLRDIQPAQASKTHRLNPASSPDDPDRWISAPPLNLTLRQSQEAKTGTRTLLKMDHKWSGWERKQKYMDLTRVQRGERGMVNTYMLDSEQAARSDSIIPPSHSLCPKEITFLPCLLSRMF